MRGHRCGPRKMRRHRPSPCKASARAIEASESRRAGAEARNLPPAASRRKHRARNWIYPMDVANKAPPAMSVTPAMNIAVSNRVINRLLRMVRLNCRTSS
jgi:hypothetical protein